MLLRFLFFSMLATVLADDPRQDQPSKNEEIERPNQFTKELYDQIMANITTKNDEDDTNLNGTDKRLHELAKLVEQRHFQVAQEFVNQATQVNHKFDELERKSERRQLQVFSHVSNQAGETYQKLHDLEKHVDKRHNQILERDEKMAKDNQESEKRLGEKFTELDKQHVEIWSQVEKIKGDRNKDRKKLDEISKLVERHLKLFELTFPEVQCKLARSANLVTLRNKKQYFFSAGIREGLSKANQTCTEMGLHLATLHNQQDADLVADHSSNFESQGWFLSGRKIVSKEGQKEYRWRDGSELLLNSTMWNSNANRDGNCVYIKDWANGRLATSNYCEEVKFDFVCELPAECYN
ncbi:uncharacterized protein LOC132193920 [Neocloeon triangulifer]|uniref:uncharacterized protein LOC132193920 n=1 Tax=Neocloeon triangulifer TaxID=2078957 RepID=UPI00286F09C7|nr:uncharacterized protein LOC132193920 [Neocloeon triangulifer]